MSLFSRIFGQNRPPSWARDFASRADFEQFVDAVHETLEASGYAVTREAIETGSVLLQRGSDRPQERFLHDLAEACATAPAARWPATIESWLRDPAGLALPSKEARDGTEGDWDQWLDESAAPGAGAPSGGTPPADLDAWVSCLPCGAVLLDDGRGRPVVCLFPVAEPRLYDRLETEPQRPEAHALLVFNHGETGILAAARVARAIGAKTVYATDAHRPVDRGVHEPSPVVPAPIREGRLGASVRLRRVAGEVHALRLSLDGAFGRLTLLAGLGLPYRALCSRPYPNVVAGTLRSDGGLPPGFSEALGRLWGAFLVEDGSGTPSADASVLSALGARVTLLGTATEAEGAPEDDLTAAARQGDLGHLSECLSGAPLDAVVEAAMVLLIADDLTAAQRLLDVALRTRGESGALRHQEGVLHLLRGDPEGACAAFAQAANSARDPAPHAWSSLAGTLDDLGRRDEAAEAAERALGALPGDPLVVQATVTVMARAGRLERAQEILASHGHVLPDQDRIGLEAALGRVAAGEPMPAATSLHFPHLADLALESGRALRAAGNLEAAERALRRAVFLNPHSLPAVADLGVVLAEQGKDAAAIALYEQALSAVPAGELLRYNLGNRYLETGRAEEAAAEYERCLAISDTWLPPRINLVSALVQLGRIGEARAHLDRLAALGADPDTLADLGARLPR